MHNGKVKPNKFSYNNTMRAIERRAYLRIEDTVHVSLQSVSEAALKNTLPETILGLPKTFSIQRELYQLELDAREINREIAADDRKLGSFTHNLNRRIELLGAVVTATFIMDNKDSSDTVMKVLDISAAGLSFVSSDLLRANSPIALKIVFSDGTHLTEPSDNDLKGKLKALNLI